jgi:hypothetical protein
VFFPFLASYKAIIHATQDKSTTSAVELPVKGENMASWNFDRILFPVVFILVNFIYWSFYFS